MRPSIALLACLLLSLPLLAEHPSKGSFPSSSPLELPPAREGKKTFKKRKAAAPKPKISELKPAAVLLSGANLDFCGKFEWSGGPETYRREVGELTELLKKNGIAAESITDEEIKQGKLWGYRSLYVVDTFALDKLAAGEIQNFVRGGGLLVAVGEIGRYQNAGWAMKWPFEELFGLKTIPADEWGGGVSRDGFLYRRAEVEASAAGDPLLKGVEGQIDFGPFGQSVWTTEPAGARVLAVYPKHLKNVKQPDGSKKYETIPSPVPALSVHKTERGNAVYIPVLPGDRKPGKLAEVAVLGTLLANAQAYAPAAGLVRITTPPPEPVLAFSQAGYLPAQRKIAVLSADPAVPIRDARFALRRFPSGKIVAEGSMKDFGRRFWNAQEWTADFSEVVDPGSYWLEASWKEARRERSLRTSVFEIDAQLHRLRLIPSQLSFFHEYRCGERCHTDSPLPGGHHDATGDWSVRMWSMPHVVYGLARYLEVDPSSSDAAREEIAHALDWCLKMQGENGEVYEGVVPPNETSDNNVRPWQEKAPRTIQKKDNLGYRLSYIAGLARAAKALRDIDSELAARALAAAVKSREFTLKDAESLKDTGEIGNWIWANMELYRATGEARYLDESKKYAEVQLKRQHRRNDEVEGATVCGDFFDGEDLKKFGRHQYKTFHMLGIYAGLIELHGALSPSDPLWWPVHAALERLVHGYFKPMASVTPYGLVGKALEREQIGDKFGIFFFDNARAWDGAHFGYNSDYLAEGLMALDYARQTGQPQLIDFAENQVGWILGINPLGYSMIDGIGTRIAPMIDDRLGTGRIFGGIPNGYEGEGAKNLPIWGETWNSAEYWLPHNSYFLPLIAELQWKRNIPAPDVPFGWNVEKRDGLYVVTVPDADKTGRKFELLVDGGRVASVNEGEAIWTVEPAGNEPLLLLLRDSQKPETYLQKFILKP